MTPTLLATPIAATLVLLAVPQHGAAQDVTQAMRACQHSDWWACLRATEMLTQSRTAPPRTPGHTLVLDTASFAAAPSAPAAPADGWNGDTDALELVGP